MAEEGTLNQEGQETQGGESSAPRVFGETKSTIEETHPTPPAAEPKNTETEDGKGKGEEGKDKTQTKPPEGEDGKGAKGKKEEPEAGDDKTKEGKEASPKDKEDLEGKLKGEDARLDKHPRFKQLAKANAGLRDEIKTLKGSIATLEKMMAKGEAGDTQGPSFKNVLALSDEEIKDQLEEDPKGFLSNFTKQVVAETREELAKEFLTKDGAKGMITEDDRDRQMASAYEQFAKDNPKFSEMWEAGEIEEYMDDKPHHTPISAFYELTRATSDEEIEKKIKTAVDEAVKKAVTETEDRVRKDMQTKRGAQTLPAGPAATGTGTGKDPRMKDSKKYGGPNAVLAEQLKEDRAQQ